MKNLKGYEIRQLWLDFWKSKGHDVVPSASLIPHNDPTLLWINAGVAPLKKYFDGREIPQNRRLTNAQKSIRTNDIENVGKTARHHTFFEMLGNFSIGDYFRNEVLPWAFELLTSEQWFDLDPEKLYFTYYPSDMETFNLWKKCGVKEDHLIPVEGNFWEIGEGPCGPDTEIFFDRGTKYDKDNLGPIMIKEDMENDRYIEIWNIVFSQFNSKPGVQRSEYKELPSKNIDTGCGLERVACVMQEVETNYDTDLFMGIIHKTEQLTNTTYHGEMAFKVIADHVRSTVFALSDGATFSNEGRGYVLRRILRRAVRYAKKLGVKEPLLYKLVPACIDTMKVFYPYLLEKEEIVTKQIKLEEEKFLTTLESGEKRLLDYINANQETKEIPGTVAFLLYDTFGFPYELTLELAEENGFTVNEEQFKEQLLKQKERARKARVQDQSMNIQNEAMMKYKDEVEFVGFESLEANSKVLALFKDGNRVLEASGKIILVLDKTPFYGIMGGQIGDKGVILLNGESFDVDDTIKLPNGQNACVVSMDETIIKVGDEVKAIVDKERRRNIEKNHSATHLLNEALRHIIGNHVFQQGSNVSDECLRFDFNNYSLLNSQEILAVEKLTKEQIDLGIKVKTFEMKLDEAKKLGVQAVFGEKYGEIVRVVDMDFSKELCGGTHVKNTKDIQEFVILNVESKGSGIFRVTAATGYKANEALENELASIINEINILNNKAKEIINESNSKGINLQFEIKPLPEIKLTYQTILDYKAYLENLKEEVKTLDKTFNKILKEKNSISMDDFLNNVLEINKINVIIKKVENIDVNAGKDLADRLSDKLGQSVIVLAIVTDKVVFIVKSKIKEVNAGAIAKKAAMITMGNGGGRPDFAQAGGKDVTKVDEALQAVKEELNKLL